MKLISKPNPIIKLIQRLFEVNRTIVSNLVTVNYIFSMGVTYHNKYQFLWWRLDVNLNAVILLFVVVGWGCGTWIGFGKRLAMTSRRPHVPRHLQFFLFYVHSNPSLLPKKNLIFFELKLSSCRHHCVPFNSLAKYAREQHTNTIELRKKAYYSGSKPQVYTNIRSPEKDARSMQTVPVLLRRLTFARPVGSIKTRSYSSVFSILFPRIFVILFFVRSDKVRFSILFTLAFQKIWLYIVWYRNLVIKHGRIIFNMFLRF